MPAMAAARSATVHATAATVGSATAAVKATASAVEAPIETTTVDSAVNATAMESAVESGTAAKAFVMGHRKSVVVCWRAEIVRDEAAMLRIPVVMIPSAMAPTAIPAVIPVTAVIARIAGAIQPAGIISTAIERLRVSVAWISAAVATAVSVSRANVVASGKPEHTHRQRDYRDRF